MLSFSNVPIEFQSSPSEDSYIVENLNADHNEEVSSQPAPFQRSKSDGSVPNLLRTQSPAPKKRSRGSSLGASNTSPAEENVFKTPGKPAGRSVEQIKRHEKEEKLKQESKEEERQTAVIEEKRLSEPDANSDAGTKIRKRHSGNPSRKSNHLFGCDQPQSRSCSTEADITGSQSATEIVREIDTNAAADDTDGGNRKAERESDHENKFLSPVWKGKSTKGQKVKGKSRMQEIPCSARHLAAQQENNNLSPDGRQILADRTNISEGARDHEYGSSRGPEESSDTSEWTNRILSELEVQAAEAQREAIRLQCELDAAMAIEIYDEQLRQISPSNAPVDVLAVNLSGNGNREIQDRLSQQDNQEIDLSDPNQNLLNNSVARSVKDVAPSPNDDAPPSLDFSRPKRPDGAPTGETEIQRETNSPEFDWDEDIFESDLYSDEDDDEDDY